MSDIPKCCLDVLTEFKDWLKSYEFHADDCGDRMVIKLTALDVDEWEPPDHGKPRKRSPAISTEAREARKGIEPAALMGAGGEPPPDAKYPCYRCGKLRTAAEGGKVFTVCDDCWNSDSPSGVSNAIGTGEGIFGTTPPLLDDHDRLEAENKRLREALEKRRIYGEEIADAARTAHPDAFEQGGVIGVIEFLKALQEPEA